ncbi:hypothetical protein [Blastochloris viridis]|uniref:Uncharacterized protein n=1 Tax=Blastochloris viridis TaxID=1079 RepID=A0A0H5B8Z1_BLAVI|nr:hypothetical protein [Blastochloris viridis]ALK08060.1 hypothetical protein BVIR_244 [Blastochloris viridis]BAR98680.1 hypothetical protein BV133_1087 [Blastochloris viridis]CUU43982.1 hypothetical protein BVIRIDIS_30100 [Blastochloris viridis]
MTALPSNFENIVSNLLFRGFQGYFRGFVTAISQVAPNLSLFKDDQTFTNESLQGRLDAIAKARTNVEATLEQLAELRRQTEQNQTELALALEQIKAIQKAKPESAQETEALEQIATIDTNSFRQTVGAPSVLDVWRERAYGFGSGFVGCILVYIILKILGAILF